MVLLLFLKQLSALMFILCAPIKVFKACLVIGDQFITIFCFIVFTRLILLFLCRLFYVLVLIVFFKQQFMFFFLQHLNQQNNKTN